MPGMLYPETSGSSQGRGRNTQKEQITFCKNTAGTRGWNKLGGEITGKVECYVENEVTHVLNCDQRGNHQKWATSTSTVDGALEEILRNSAPHLWEKQLLEIIDQFDD